MAPDGVPEVIGALAAINLPAGARTTS